MTSPLALFIAALSSAPAKPHYPPSTHVAHIVRSVTKQDIHTTFTCLNKSLPIDPLCLTNEAILDEINSTVRSLLKGTDSLKELYPEQQVEVSLPSDLQNLPFDSLKQKAYTLIASKAPEIKELALSLIPTPYSGIATSIAQNCVKALASTHAEQQAQKSHELNQEAALHGHPILNIAHEIACDKAIELIFTIHCEKARTCDRMAALFIINHCTLTGKKGRILQTYVARLNRYYFAPSGLLRWYDPQLGAQRSKRIKSLTRFLTTICSTKALYLKHLKMGISMGIPELADRFFADRSRNWRPRNRSIRLFTTSLLQTLVGSQMTLWKKVDPALVREQAATKSCMALIDLCAFSPKMNGGSMREYAQTLINTYKASSPFLFSVLNRYYHEATSSS